jgi:hypothetical protein
MSVVPNLSSGQVSFVDYSKDINSVRSSGFIELDRFSKLSDIFFEGYVNNIDSICSCFETLRRRNILKKLGSYLTDNAIFYTILANEYVLKKKSIENKVISTKTTETTIVLESLSITDDFVNDEKKFLKKELYNDDFFDGYLKIFTKFFLLIDEIMKYEYLMTYSDYEFQERD